MIDMAVELINSAISEDLEPAEAAVRGGQADGALAAIENAIAKLNNALSMLDSPEASHGSAGPIV